MMFLWQRLVFDLPRGGGGDSGGGGEGGGGGFDAGTAGDVASFAGASAAGETQAGVSMGDAAAEAAGNIAGTSGGADQAAANAAATGNAMTQAAFGALGVGEAAPSASVGGTSVSPTVSAPAVESVSVENALGNTSIGGFGLAGAMGGVAGANVSGGLGAIGSSATQSAGISPSVSVGGVAELGDTGPQGFAASESGFGPSTTAADVSGAMGALGLGGTAADFAGSTSSLAGAMAGGLGSLGALGSTDNMADIGIADPTGMGTGFTGFGTGNVSAAQAIASIGAQNIGAYSTPAAQPAPTSTVGMPTGNAAFSVGLAPSTATAAPASVSPATSAFSGMTGAQLAGQLGGMTQPSAQSAGVSPSVGPSVGSYGFSGMSVGGAPGLAGTATTSAPSAAPSTSTPSSLADAAAGRSASSMSVESFTDPLTGSPVSVTTIDGVPSYSAGSVAPSGIAGFMGSPAVSTLANTALSVAVPGYGLANLGVMGLTGTSIYGQGVSLATGQGLQTGGGLIGLAGNANFGQGAGPIGTASGGGSGGGSAGGEGLSPTAEIPTPQYTPVESQISDAPVQAIPYNLANFGPTPMPGYRVVPTPSPAFYGNTLTKPQLPPAAYFTPQGYPTNPPIPGFYSD